MGEYRVAEHSMFHVLDGIIELFADQRYRFSIRGNVQAGSNITLGDCAVNAHQKLRLMKNGQIKVIDNPTMCLNAKSGAGPGAEIVTYQCGADGATTENEEFVHGKDG